MGPPIYIGGNKNKQIAFPYGKFASMGPPIYIGGNLDVYETSDEDVYGFNGATDLHRWKLVLM